MSSMPSTLLNHDKTVSVGKNSYRARQRSYFRQTPVVAGRLMFHICMKIRNCIKFMMFHRYFSPNARKN